VRQVAREAHSALRAAWELPSAAAVLVRQVARKVHSALRAAWELPSVAVVRGRRLEALREYRRVVFAVWYPVLILAPVSVPALFLGGLLARAFRRCRSRSQPQWLEAKRH
jgi:hypothetical protein